MNYFGFVRVTAATIKTQIGACQENAQEIMSILKDVPDSDVVVFPECCVTGYTCADLFGQSALLQAAVDATFEIAEATAGSNQLVLVGLPVAVENSLYNCGVALFDGQVIGIIPKQFVPNYKEFYESRWFCSAIGTEPELITFGEAEVPFGIDLLFQSKDAIIGVEICEDLWMPIPPSSHQAIAGANILVNLSASNELIGKARYRTDLVVGQSARCIAGYVYSSAGPTESTTDLVFSGHCMIAENSYLLEESPRVGDGQQLQRGSYFITSDIDIEKLQSERRKMTTFDDSQRFLVQDYRRIVCSFSEKMEGLERTIPGTPFVPGNSSELEARCAEIFGIQCAALAKRVEQLPADLALNIGISGGLDSTLALLVAVKMSDAIGRSRKLIHGYTMPGFGTTEKTKSNALDLMDHLGITQQTIDIQPLCLEAFRSLKHLPFNLDYVSPDLEMFQQQLKHVPEEQRSDLVFENVQARMRTFLLMSQGFVVGTGDLSESALGWSTYNGDHMSMYNPNCSIPKTLVKFLVQYVANHEFEGEVRETLLSISETTISPELLPPSAEGEIVQSTEDTLGPYELHDFFLFHSVRNGFSPEKILFLAQHAEFSESYNQELIESTLKTFYRRFVSNQFKRSCIPDGPKVGTVSLSPRGDWRMPSDASSKLFDF